MPEEVVTAIPRISKLEASRNRRRAWMGLGLLFLLGGAAMGPWLKERWKTAEGRKLSNEAAKLVAAGEADRAIPLLVKAWQKAPKDPSVLRELARTCDELPSNAPQAALFWQRLTDSGQATPGDRLALAAALVRIEDAKAARAVLNSLPGHVRQTLKGVEVEAALLGSEGHEEEASRMLLDAWRNAPGDLSARLRLATVEFSSPFADVRDEAGQRLWEIAGGDGKEAVEAMQILASSSPSLAHAEEIRGLVSKKSGISNADRLRILGACISQFPKLTAEVVAEESRRVEGRPPESIPEFYEWLARLGMATRILQDLGETQRLPASSPPDPRSPTLVPKPAVLKSRDLFLAYGDALIAAERWNDFAAVLSKPGLPIDRTDLELMEALCARGLSQPTRTVEAHLASALQMARNARGLDALFHVADTAEKLGVTSIALEALDLLSSNRKSRLECLKRIFRLQQDLTDPDGRLRTAEAILKMQPGLAPYGDEALYLSLLTGKGLEQALHRVATSPEGENASGTPLRRLAGALAAYQCGDAELVRQRLEGLAPGSLTAGPRAVLAGLLAETGREIDAFRIAEKIRPAALAPDEIWFHRKAIQGHGSGS